MKALSQRYRFLVQALLTLLGVCYALGATWSPQEHGFADERWLLKVEPPEKVKQGTPGPCTLSLLEKTSEGLEVRWEGGHSGHSERPLRAYVADDGQYVVLHNPHDIREYRPFTVILGPGGETLGSYKLKDVLPHWESRIMRASYPYAVGRWRPAWCSLLENDRRFGWVTERGTVRCFDLASGNLIDLNEEQRTDIVDRVRDEAEAWLQTNDTGARIRAISLLGALRVRDASDIAKELFQDRTPDGVVTRAGSPSAEVFSMQKAAALALVRILGAEAIPLIEAELPLANWHMKEQLLKALESLDTQGSRMVQTPASSAALAMWLRLSASADKDIRHWALRQVLRRQGGSYLLSHPEVIRSEETGVRSAALEAVGNLEYADALPLLRQAMKDPDGLVRRSAIRQFIGHDPPDLEKVLLEHLDDPDSNLRTSMICELARRGHPAALEQLNVTLSTWSGEDSDQLDRYQFAKLCKLIIKLRLVSAREVLQKYHLSGGVYATGALAATGDEEALRELHRLAHEEGSRSLFPRMYATDVCRYLTDEKSRAIAAAAPRPEDMLAAIWRLEAEGPYTMGELLRLSDNIIDPLPTRGERCPECGVIIPQFEDLSEEDEASLGQLIREGNNARAMREIRSLVSFCPASWAKIWVGHSGRPDAVCVTPHCPYCGKPLNTSHGKQCAHCDMDWHDPDHPKRLESSEPVGPSD